MVWDGVDDKANEKLKKYDMDGVEKADTHGETILKSFVRYPFSEPLGTMVTAAGTGSNHDVVWICTWEYLNEISVNP